MDLVSVSLFIGCCTVSDMEVERNSREGPLRQFANAARGIVKNCKVKAECEVGANFEVGATACPHC